MVGLKGSAKSLLSNTLLCNVKLLSKIYSLKKYKKLTVEDCSKEKK